MLYTSNYFDNCNGLIPQIVLSSCLLQAGNERAAIYKNQLTTDNSKTTTFSFDGSFLNIRGLLPLAESRYLITQSSLINRIGAVNSENASMFGDIIGLPVNGFLPRSTQQSVVLPSNVESLSIAPLVIEKRLAYLVLLQQKRNRLIELYNFLHYTNLASAVIRSRNVVEPVIGIISYRTAVWNGNSLTIADQLNGVIGYNYSYVSDPVGRSTSIVDICLNALARTYPDMLRFNTGNKTLEQWSEWVVTELAKNNPILISPIDFNLLVDSVSEAVAAIRLQPTPRNPLGYVANESGTDVSATISSGDSRNDSVDVPTPFGSSGNDSPLLPATPTQDYQSQTNQNPSDTLPPC
jgi:hypothetical protein